MFFEFPAILLVYATISSLIYLKSYKYFLGACKNSPYSFDLESYNCLKLNMRGHRVTIPLPLGKKSLPTIDSNTELLPAD